MSDQGSTAAIDVFLSYKREEREVAQRLAEYLTERGFDVWWDAALLAGEDFATIVHEELQQARAVVVLWSKQARTSHWVREEAALALARGTLINAVIDNMPFEGIPPEYSHIQALRLGENAAEFAAEIAAAILRKGTAPSHGGRSADEARSNLATKVKDADFFGAIAQSRDADDFRDYLAQFGEEAQFARIALRKIAALEKAAAEQRSFTRRLRIAGAGLAVVIGVVASIATILGYLGVEPQPGPDPASVADPATPVAATGDEGPAVEDASGDPAPPTEVEAVVESSGDTAAGVPSESDEALGTPDSLLSWPSVAGEPAATPTASIVLRAADGTETDAGEGTVGWRTEYDGSLSTIFVGDLKIPSVLLSGSVRISGPQGRLGSFAAELVRGRPITVAVRLRGLLGTGTVASITAVRSNDLLGGLGLNDGTASTDGSGIATYTFDATGRPSISEARELEILVNLDDGGSGRLVVGVPSGFKDLVDPPSRSLMTIKGLLDEPSGIVAPSLTTGP